ncbi:MAG TPA: CDF family Co(II)/Ni(II) efflux transporter DmeF [Xanthobacteraceae bacterium]|jgi:cation diffusion facilitator family transporter|nr:CDF family Co(II)/Ni(II) efflux transporter DmeF [Xanthobacteraceae bacterium]
MSNLGEADFTHRHVFLGAGHARNERRTWAVIALCTVMMVAEIAGGLAFGSIALVADGLHMSTHAAALLLAALAYSYARRHADDARFSFGTGKLGDLAGYTSAVVLAMIAILIGYESVMRLVSPVAIRYDEAIAIATIGLFVNVASVFLLGTGGHDHEHGHTHGHTHGHAHHDHDDGPGHHDGHHHGHPHDRTHRDNNLRAAVIHVIADAAVSVLVIAGLLLARFLGWVWMDPVAGLLGAMVIASWAYGLVRDTGSILLDMTHDRNMAENIRMAIERDGDILCDLHLWRLGPGHVGAIVSITTAAPRPPAFYRERLASFPALSHVTIEVHPRDWQRAGA